MSGPAWNIGLRAARAEHQSTDQHGRPVDPATETPTARSERIKALQESWTPKEMPATAPAAVFAEWMQNPENRMSKLAQMVAENPARLMPAAEMEPGPGQEPIPGGLVEQVYGTAAERMAHAKRNASR